MLRLIVLLLGAVVSTSLASQEFALCKGYEEDKLGLSSLDFLPNPPCAGTDLEVQVQGVTGVDLSQTSRIKVEVKVYGVVVEKQTVPVCDVLASCPVRAGESYQGSFTVSIPAETPSHIRASVHMYLEDGEGAPQTCLETSAEVEPAQQQQLGATRPLVDWIFAKWKAQFPGMSQGAQASVFAANWERVVAHNAQAGQSWRMQMNEFGAMTGEEFVRTRMGIRAPSREAAGDVAQVRLRAQVDRADPPEEVDWVAKGMVSPVKNQGQCGSCWAFSTIAALESAYAIQTGKLIEFSEQELVSCDTVDQACNGGLMDNAFDWLEHNLPQGLCTEQDYPYTSGTTGARGQCLKECQAVPGTIPQSYVDVQPNEAALQAALATHGPVAVAIEADQAAFQFYHSGVMNGVCGSRLDHGVLLVGYGTDAESGLKFWKIKNSWGPAWGEEGYIRIVRGKRWPRGGECGIAAAASYPIFAGQE